MDGMTRRTGAGDGVSAAIPADGPIASDVSFMTCVWSRSVIHCALARGFLPSQRDARLVAKNSQARPGRTYPLAMASRPALAREVNRNAGNQEVSIAKMGIGRFSP